MKRRIALLVAALVVMTGAKCNTDNGEPNCVNDNGRPAACPTEWK